MNKIYKYMKKILLLAALFTFPGPLYAQQSSLLSQESSSQISHDVNTSFNGLVDAVIKLDHEKYFSYFDEQKYTALNEDGSVTHSFKDFHDAYLPQVAYIDHYLDLKFNNVKIDVIDENTAVLVNEYVAEVKLTTGDVITAAGAGTQVWSKRTGEWKLVNVSSSAKPQE